MKRLAAFLLCAVVACTPRTRQQTSPEGEKAPGEKDRRVVEVDLTGGAPETAGSGLFELPATRTYTGLVRALERAANDPLSAGLFVRFGSEKVDFARAEELGALFARFRDKRLPVVCHAHDYSNASAGLAARGCSRIWVSAAGSVDTVGIAAELVYLKGLLDKLKIGVDFLSMGKYKGGAEPLMREGPSEATLESYTATLGSMREAWLNSAEQGRPGIALREKFEQGPYSPEEAKAANIVDAVGFESEALAEARRLSKTEFVGAGFGPRTEKDGRLDIGKLVQLLAGSGEDTSGRPRLAVVPAEGAIGMEPGGPLDSGGGIAAKSLNRTLKRLREDDSVKAVVLRIDSPGGSPLASDLIWHELMQLRKKKTVIASVGGMAASGGYYIASGAQRIVAERSSIVGSIGVFGGKIVIGPALQEFGVNSAAIPASPNPGAAERAGYLSPFRPWDDATRERVRTGMRSIYDLFISRVAEGRKMPAQSVRDSAEGRIWSGTQGKERGLVDELGGLSHAIDLARKLAGLERDIMVTVEGPKDGLLDRLLLGEGASEGDIRAALARLERQSSLLQQLPQELRVHASSLAPLLGAEHVLVALPMAVVLR